jgi:cysteine desulfuration protein SufE
LSTLASRVAEIESDLEILERDEKFEWLIDLGRDLRVTRSFVEDDRIRGCQAMVWLTVEPDGGHLKLEGDSDALIVKGLVALLVQIYHNATPAEAREFDFLAWMERVGISLSMQRMQGLSGMLTKIRSVNA